MTDAALPNPPADLPPHLITAWAIRQQGMFATDGASGGGGAGPGSGPKAPPGPPEGSAGTQGDPR